MGKGSATRERILEIAEASVLAKGLGATSIEEVIVEAGITKSGFFYHFHDKNELARAMMVRYVEANDRIFAEIFARADELADGDPLQSFLIGLKLLSELMSDLPNGHPGCLVAAVCYQERLYDREVREITTRSVESWNALFRGRLEAIVMAYPTAEPIDLEAAARLVSCVVDGGIIMSKTLADPKILPQQILMVRSYIKLLFQPAAAARIAA
jgi:TetR/AcrR family transcriptional regulator, transcriptional repressor for nem operon